MKQTISIMVLALVAAIAQSDAKVVYEDKVQTCWDIDERIPYTFCIAKDRTWAGGTLGTIDLGSEVPTITYMCSSGKEGYVYMAVLNMQTDDNFQFSKDHVEVTYHSTTENWDFSLSKVAPVTSMWKTQEGGRLVTFDEQIILDLLWKTLRLGRDQFNWTVEESPWEDNTAKTVGGYSGARFLHNWSHLCCPTGLPLDEMPTPCLWGSHDAREWVAENR